MESWELNYNRNTGRAQSLPPWNKCGLVSPWSMDGWADGSGVRCKLMAFRNRLVESEEGWGLQVLVLF